MILSTGMSDLGEIDAAVAVVRRLTDDWAVLQCTSLYPTPDRDVHLRVLPELVRRYGAVVGFSDHTLGVEIAPAAVALGAAIVEKHVTLDRRAKGSDHACSAEPRELGRLVERIRRIDAALGCAEKQVAAGVAANRLRLGRSVVARSALPAGTVLRESLLTLMSPGGGLRWTDCSQLVGRRLVHDVAAGRPLSQQDVA
jgi:N-acetylneuraminate synthase/N,N'-diacetyllegionaminate synthase